jgi:hypothetical protein
MLARTKTYQHAFQMWGLIFGLSNQGGAQVDSGRGSMTVEGRVARSFNFYFFST